MKQKMSFLHCIFYIHLCSFVRAIIPNIAERAVKVEVDNDDGKTKDEEKTKRTATNTQHSPPQDSIPSPPGYVSYHIFNQLLERVN